MGRLGSRTCRLRGVKPRQAVYRGSGVPDLPVVGARISQRGKFCMSFFRHTQICPGSVSWVCRMTSAATENITKEFLNKFKSDKRKFGEKLKAIGIARATYADLRYNRRDPKKKTVEAMLAYLENRAAKYDQVDHSKDFYCCCCEKSAPLSKQYDRWTCKPCKNKERHEARKRFWPRHLGYMRASKLRRKYGKFAQCMRLIINIKKEMKINEKTNFISRVTTE